MSKKRTMQIDVIEEVKGTQFMQCKLYIDGNASVILMNKIDYERLLSDSFFVRDGKNRDSAGVLNTTNTFLEKNRRICNYLRIKRLFGLHGNWVTR